MAGSIFPASGRFRIAFLTYPRSKNIKISKIMFYCKFPYILFGVFAGVILLGGGGGGWGGGLIRRGDGGYL